MFRKSLTILLLALTSSAVSADDHSLEPCINGDVSRSGNYPSREMEDQMNTYRAWQASQPYYLFKVSGRNLPTVYPQR